MELKVKRLMASAKLPERGSRTAAGADLFAAENLFIEPGERAMVATGIAIEMPQECYGRVAPRSGHAVKYGINVLAGVIDSDYRGEVKVVLHNTGDETFQILAGDKIAQLILEKYVAPMIREADELSNTERGQNGFGSTGN